MFDILLNMEWYDLLRDIDRIKNHPLFLLIGVVYIMCLCLIDKRNEEKRKEEEES